MGNLAMGFVFGNTTEAGCQTAVSPQEGKNMIFRLLWRRLWRMDRRMKERAEKDAKKEKETNDKPVA